MSLGVLNNISAIYAENNLNQTQSSLQNVLTQLSSGSRINSGADDAAGLSLADGLQANETALTQSSMNASDGSGMLQTADGALSQVTTLLNRAVTLATEASNGTMNSTQDAAANQEFQSILAEINNIGSTTTYNGQAVFGSTTDIYTGDGTTAGGSIDALTVSALASATVGDANGTLTYTAAAGAVPATISYATGTQADLSADTLTTSAAAQTALTDVTNAITDVAGQRGYLGSQINTLNAVSNVESTQQENLASASNNVLATNYGQATSQMSSDEILSQTGISALAQANSVQQEVLKLLQ
ncbi:MAG TPA: flagellin [Acidobacteriaceae bacterium]|jgi:flagellin|nr:flagellin [Acidobacteriaceae bacterium]